MAKLRLPIDVGGKPVRRAKSVGLVKRARKSKRQPSAWPCVASRLSLTGASVLGSTCLTLRRPRDAEHPTVHSIVIIVIGTIDANKILCSSI